MKDRCSWLMNHNNYYYSFRKLSQNYYSVIIIIQKYVNYQTLTNHLKEVIQEVHDHDFH